MIVGRWIWLGGWIGWIWFCCGSIWGGAAVFGSWTTCGASCLGSLNGSATFTPGGAMVGAYISNWEDTVLNCGNIVRLKK